jgi:glycosyltransferase involved in cell wall biosynthesis
MPDISLVVPFRNEESYLPATLASLAAQTMGPYSAEVLLVDGASDDRSREVILPFLEYESESVVFRLLDNPSRTTPYAFNIGIAHATSPIVGFGGAHTNYPSTYLRRAVEVMRESAADVVGGGHDRFEASSHGIWASAMACLYQSPMGAGVAAYHRRQTPGFVDTVYGGFYRREVFDSVGNFDVRLTRNQDNEFNSRVTGAGFRIYFHPDLSTTYVQKTDLPSFVRRAFLFGRYHPVTWRTNPKSFRIRHALPAVFVVYLIVALALSATGVRQFWFWAPLVLYALLLLLAAVKLQERTSALSALATIVLFPLYHIGYGTGTLAGVVAEMRANSPMGDVNAVEQP